MSVPQVDYPAPYDALEEVTRLDAQGISVRRRLRAEEIFFRGHYPHQAIFPGIFILEAVVQAVKRFAASLSAEAKLETVQTLRFRSPLGPGDEFEVHCACGPLDPDGRFIVKAKCRSGANPVAEAKAQFVRVNHA